MLLLISGTSGVGKSTARRLVQGRLDERVQAVEVVDLAPFPVVSGEILATPSANKVDIAICLLRCCATTWRSQTGFATTPWTLSTCSRSSPGPDGIRWSGHGSGMYERATPAGAYRSSTPRDSVRKTSPTVRCDGQPAPWLEANRSSVRVGTSAPGLLTRRVGHGPRSRLCDPRRSKVERLRRERGTARAPRPSRRTGP
jgi:hypothetical protein